MNLNVKHPGYIIGFAALVSAAFTAGIVTLQVATAARVERNEVLREYRAVARLFAPYWDDVGSVEGLTDERTIELVDARVRQDRKVVDETTDPPTEFRLYEAYETKKHETLVGIGFPVWGNGFWAPIRGLMAVTPDRKDVLGMVFMEQRETPGLGGRIMESEFMKQFSKAARKEKDQPPLEATPPEEGEKFVYVGRGGPSGPADPRHGRSVDAITGATQTSIAVEVFLNRRLEQFHRAWEAGKQPVAAPKGG